MRLLFALLLVACHTPRVELVEGYCPHGEAPRCYFAHPPEDGF